MESYIDRDSLWPVENEVFTLIFLNRLSRDQSDQEHQQ